MAPSVLGSTRTLLLATAGAAGMVSATQGAILRVPSEYATIRDGLESAAPKDTVLVACGTYFEHELPLKPRVMLRSESGSADCATVDAQGLGRVFVCVDAAQPPILEGFTITGGRGLPGTAAGGGGIHCARSKLNVSRCLFSDNASNFGGGVGCHESTLTLVDCRFEANEASGESWAAGGGLFCVDSTPTLTGCTFASNSASSAVLPGDGGGVFSWDSETSATDCVFLENFAGAGGGGMYSYALDRPSLARCTFASNHSASGAGMYMETSNAQLDDCLFLDNVAATGRGLLIAQGSAAEFRGCLFSGNRSSPFSGGGISCWHSVAVFRRCRFLRNETELDGGGVFAGGVSRPILEECLMLRNVAGRKGGAIRGYFASRVDVTACTFAENSAPSGSTLSVESSGPAAFARSILAFAPSGASVVCDEPGFVTLSCCNVYGNEDGDWIDCIADQFDTAGNIAAEPMFCAPASGDFALREGSPCAPEYTKGCGLIGAFGVGCGVVSAGSGVRLESWAGIKALYR